MHPSAMHLRILAPVLLTLSVFGLAVAADNPQKQASFGNGKSGGPILTKDQLRNCLSQQSRSKQQDADLLKEQNSLSATKADIAQSGDSLKQELDSLDHSSETAVAAYNEKAQTRDKQIDEYQARVTAFNDRVESSRSEHEAFSKACDNRRYLVEDEAAIKKGK
jgi:hypothetical protein